MAADEKYFVLSLCVQFKYILRLECLKPKIMDGLTKENVRLTEPMHEQFIVHTFKGILTSATCSSGLHNESNKICLNQWRRNCHERVVVMKESDDL